MTRYVFTVNRKHIVINKPSHGPRRRLPKRPVCDRDHQESTMNKWNMNGGTAQQRISLNAWKLQIAAGHVSHRSSCGHGRYTVRIYLVFLQTAYDRMY